MCKNKMSKINGRLQRCSEVKAYVNSSGLSLKRNVSKTFARNIKNIKNLNR